MLKYIPHKNADLHYVVCLHVYGYASVNSSQTAMQSGEGLCGVIVVYGWPEGAFVSGSEVCSHHTTVQMWVPACGFSTDHMHLASVVK